MKKGSTALRLFLYASLVSLIWLGGYVLLSGFFAVEEKTPENVTPTVTPGVSVPAPEATQWSVLVVTDEEREVTDFLFRYADFLADTLVFVRVPVNTKTELATGGHEVLKVYEPAAPKIFMISDLCNIFSEDIWCMVAEEVGVALLGVRPQECYIIEQSVYENLTETVNGEVRFVIAANTKERITTAVQNAVTNDTLQEEMVYLESYRDLDVVLYVQLPGAASAEEFRPDAVAIQGMAERFRSGMFSEEP